MVMKDYYTVIISEKELRATEKFKETDWISWCWEYVGVDNFNWTIDAQFEYPGRGFYTYIIRFEYEEDKLLFILNWV